MTLLADGSDEIMNEASDEGDEEDIDFDVLFRSADIEGDIEDSPELVDNIALGVKDKDDDDDEHEDEDGDDDGDDQGEGAEHRLSYITVATNFMDLLMKNTLATHSAWCDADWTCPICQEDEIMSPDGKVDQRRAPSLKISPNISQDKRRDSEAKLNDHMASTVHSGHMKWRREAKMGADQHPQKLYICPYDHTLGKPFETKHIKDLIRHIEGTGLSNASEAYKNRI